MMSEFPLFFFTTCGGLSAGLAVAAALLPAKSESKRAWLVPLLCLALLGVGLLGVLFHLERPERFVFGMLNPTAGIAQEAYCSIALCLVYLAQLILAWRKGSAPRGLAWAAGALGLALTFIMGFAYVAVMGMEAWSSWQTVPLFVIGDIAMGLALWGVVSEDARRSRPFGVASVVVQTLFAVSALLEAMHFASVGENGALFYAGAVVSAVLAVASAVLTMRAKPQGAAGNDVAEQTPRSVPSRLKTLAVIAFVMALAGVVLARLAFYMVA